MSQFKTLPSNGSSTTTLVAEGANGSTAPTSSLEVSGINPSGNLTPLATDASGNLLVNVAAGGGSSTVTANQGTPGSTAWPISFPAAQQVVGSGAANNAGVSVFARALDGTLNYLKQDANNNLLVAIAAEPLSNLNVNVESWGNTQVSLGQGTLANSIPVVIANNQILVTSSEAQNGVSLPTNITVVGGNQEGYPETFSLDSMGNLEVKANSARPANPPVYLNYTTTNVTTTAFTQLIAASATTINKLYIYDSSGQAMILAIGAAGSETTQFYVPPGGGAFDFNISINARISYKALTANATTGYVIMNTLQ